MLMALFLHLQMVCQLSYRSTRVVSGSEAGRPAAGYAAVDVAATVKASCVSQLVNINSYCSCSCDVKTSSRDQAFRQ